MIDRYRIFRFDKGGCPGESNEGGLIPCAFFARSPGGRTVMLRYHLLRGDTVAPSGLYTLGFAMHF